MQIFRLVFSNLLCIIKIIDQTYAILQILHFIKSSTIYFRIKVRNGLLGTCQIFPYKVVIIVKMFQFLLNCVYMYVYVYMYMYVYMYIYICIDICMYVCVYVCVYVCLYICMNKCMYYNILKYEWRYGCFCMNISLYCNNIHPINPKDRTWCT